MPAWLTECIAERELDRPDDKGRAVVVRLGKPRRVRGGDWECRYEIRGLRPTRRFQAYGVDALQALSLAQHMLRVDLEKHCPRLTWVEEPCFRGIPLQAPMLLPRKYEMRIEAAIERASNAFYREMKERHEHRRS